MSAIDASSKRRINETYPRCTVCGKQKKPVGRDLHPSIAHSFCFYFSPDDGCEGYNLPPRAHHLWPSEIREQSA